MYVTFVNVCFHTWTDYVYGFWSVIFFKYVLLKVFLRFREVLSIFFLLQSLFELYKYIQYSIVSYLQRFRSLSVCKDYIDRFQSQVNVQQS